MSGNIRHTRTIETASLDHWQEEIKEYVKLKFGNWYSWEQAPKALMYIVSECGEALEAWRDNDPVKFMEELADMIIRAADTAYWHHAAFEGQRNRAGLYTPTLTSAMRIKMDYNWTRPKNHGRDNV